MKKNDPVAVYRHARRDGRKWAEAWCIDGELDPDSVSGDFPTACASIAGSYADKQAVPAAAKVYVDKCFQLGAAHFVKGLGSGRIRVETLKEGMADAP